MKANQVIFEKPSWEAAVLVCKDCGKRSSGPRELKIKVVVSELKRSLRKARPRPRCVLTSCLGLCPKGAVAVALAGGDKPARITAIRSLDEAEAVGEEIARRAG